MRHVANADHMDIRQIVEHLSVQNDAERRSVGLTENQLIELLTGLAGTGHSEVELHEGRPVAAFGVNVSSDGAFNNTWFIATSRFFEMGVAGIRFARTRIKYYRERYELPLRSISLSPVAEAPKWFRALGFVEAGHVDGCRVFVYR